MAEDNQADRLAALREENEFLRQAARTFGELAERLSKELHAMRRAEQRRLIGSSNRRRPSYPTLR